MSVEKIIADYLEVSIDKVTDDANLIDDLGADSLHIVELVLAFETNYDIEISDEEASELATVGDIKSYISANT
jgi:acyl carrier protein